MMKPLVVATIFIAFAAFCIYSIGAYLGPDDLRGCTEPTQDGGACDEADAIIALSGGDTNARANEAIRLYKLGWAPIIIFSGAAADPSGPSNAAAMRKIALGEGRTFAAGSMEAVAAAVTRFFVSGA